LIIFWLVAFVLFLIIEAATASLASIWFALGALVALISTALGAPLWMQIAWFIVVSAVTLYFTRPLAKKYLAPKRSATNADRLINETCAVTEDIDNIAGTGAVSIEGKIWTARSAGGEHIAKGTLVRVTAIEGVKLIVTPAVDATLKQEQTV
jgi:membrane protein implicated in regulation of membrane protease activity